MYEGYKEQVRRLTRELLEVGLKSHTIRKVIRDLYPERRCDVLNVGITAELGYKEFRGGKRKN
jgi:hypothetical protein